MPLANNHPYPMSTRRRLDLMQQLFKVMSEIGNNLERTMIPSDGVITPLQCKALSYLLANHNATVGMLGKYMHLSSSAVAQLGDRLVAAKLVKRAPHPDDRRAVILDLTAKGRKTFLEFESQRKKGMTKIFEYLPEDDLEKIVGFFTKILKNTEHEKNS